MGNPQLLRLINLEEWLPDDEQAALNLDEPDRILLAKNINYDGLLVDFSYDPCVSVRIAVALNKNTPIYILKRLSNEDNSNEVRIEAASTLKGVGL